MNTRSVCFLAWVFVCILALAIPAWSQLSAEQIYGRTADTHPGLVFLTYDDLMDDTPIFGGRSQTLLVKDYLASQGIPAEFFMVGCHIYDQPLPNPATGMCNPEHNNVPFSELQELSDAGFHVGNHSFSHIPFKQLTADQILWEIRTNQAVVDMLHQTLGLKTFRCPGLDCDKLSSLTTQRDLKDFSPPFNLDVGGGFYTDNIQPVMGLPAGSQVGGDPWFYSNGIPPEVAVYYYVRDTVILAEKFGPETLFHLRSEGMAGSDGSRGFPLKLTQGYVTGLPKAITFGPLDGIPGHLGNIRTTTPQLVSSEFGTSDGQGRVVAGHIVDGPRQEICKARGGSVRCATWQTLAASKPLAFDRAPTNEPALMLAPSKSWRDIPDPDWRAKYGSKIWLVDLNGDGRDDLVVPASLGPSVGYSNGINGFSKLEPLLAAGNLDYRTLRFADINKDGLPDIVDWIGGVAYTYINNGHGFSAPLVASTDFDAATFGSDLYVSAMQAVDLDGDGCADLLMRNATDVNVALGDCQGKFLPAVSWTKRFCDRQNFSMPSQNLTFSAAKIAGKAGLAAGLFTGGIVFQEADPAKGRFGQYRYIMDNRSYSGDPNFHPEAYASDVVFADLFGNGDTVPLQVRLQGLYVSRVRIIK